MSEERQAEYIKGKYGKWGLDRWAHFLSSDCEWKPSSWFVEVQVLGYEEPFQKDDVETLSVVLQFGVEV